MNDAAGFKGINYQIKNIQSYPTMTNNFRISKSLPELFFEEYFCNMLILLH